MSSKASYIHCWGFGNVTELSVIIVDLLLGGKSLVRRGQSWWVWPKKCSLPTHSAFWLLLYEKLFLCHAPVPCHSALDPANHARIKTTET